MVKEDRRLLLHNILVGLFPDVDIWYRPPGDLILSRPCIIYTDTQEEPAYANNKVYVMGTRFQITVLSDRTGIAGLDVIFDAEGITVNSHRSYTEADIVHDVFNVSINTI